MACTCRSIPHATCGSAADVTGGHVARAQPLPLVLHGRRLAYRQARVARCTCACSGRVSTAVRCGTRTHPPPPPPPRRALALAGEASAWHRCNVRVALVVLFFRSVPFRFFLSPTPVDERRCITFCCGAPQIAHRSENKCANAKRAFALRLVDRADGRLRPGPNMLRVTHRAQRAQHATHQKCFVTPRSEACNTHRDGQRGSAVLCCIRSQPGAHTLDRSQAHTAATTCTAHRCTDRPPTVGAFGLTRQAPCCRRCRRCRRGPMGS